ncbi:MAG: ClbS/DfsB family four-helix bundle protein [Chloroflexi bacterium]|nr:MAG: ClbS/DfsB family four-helix bundle protein [Chloroflexota bacterium]
MTQSHVTTKSELLSAIDAGWASLTDALAQLSEAQLTGSTDAAGWNGKDHIVHLAAWERSMLYLLAGQPRHAGLGVDGTLYLSGDFDAINAAIQSQQRDTSLADALTELRQVHKELRVALDELTDADLQKTYSHYLPDEPGDDDGSPIIDRLAGNTSEHFTEHLPWILALAVG